MHFYWYWPFAREEELAWAEATARSGEHVTVHVIDRAIAPTAGVVGATTVVRDLPDVERATRGAASWAASRASTYRARDRRRRDMWRSGTFDLVHLHYLNRFTDGWSPMPHPLVMSVHDVVPHVRRLGRRGEHALLARTYRRADALVVHHQRLADQIASDFGIPGTDIHVVPHQVFPVSTPPSDATVDPPEVLCFGALRPNKGVELLGEVARRLGPDVPLIIAGRGDAQVESQALAAAATHSQVHAEIGQVTAQRKAELFRRASVVVLPYTAFSSQSGVLHDAYGHGRPVVVTDVGALGDTVREDGTGLVVPPNDPDALAAAVRDVLEPAAWRSYADAAKRIARERSPEVTGVRLRAVYDAVL